MTLGLILALVASFSFAIGIVIIRRALAETGESFSVTAICIITGVPYFTVAMTVAGDWGKILTSNWQAIALLGMAGIIHFIIGRLFGFSAIRLIGANKATPFIMTVPLYTLLLSFFLLGENITAFIISGVLFMFLGTALTSVERKTAGPNNQGISQSVERKGILLALAAAVCWGITPVMIKPGVEQIGSSIAGAFVSYCAACVVLFVLLTRKSLRHQLTHLASARSLSLIFLASLFTTTGQLLFYVALEKIPASIISPLMSTQAIFIFFLSWLVNRRSEVFSWKVSFGILATIAGTILLVR